MTSDVVSVGPDTTVQEIARLLLDKRIGAVPVLDSTGTPVGMVSDGDLFARDEADRLARRDWWLEMLAEDSPADADLLSAQRSRELTASEVMSKPVITIGEDADAAEIARLFQSYKIKRAPVVRHGRVVGIVSRENLLRALEKTQAAHPAAQVRSWLLSGLSPQHDIAPSKSAPHPSQDGGPPTVSVFQRIVDGFADRERGHRADLRRAASEEHEKKVEAAFDQHITDDAWRKLMQGAREAADRGEEEFLLLRFPSELCSDGGRAVNVPEPDWPATLRGEAAEVYLRWEQELKPGGFHIAARVIDFPDGMPGDIGLFLTWRR
jgi:CBS domain-containing protein